MGDGHQSDGQQGRGEQCCREDLLLGAKGKSHRAWFSPWVRNGLFTRVWLQGQCLRSTHLNPAQVSGHTSKCKVKLLSTSRINPHCS